MSEIREGRGARKFFLKKKKFPLSQAVEVRRGMETNHRSATTTRRGDARVQCSVFVMSSVGLAAG